MFGSLFSSPKPAPQPEPTLEEVTASVLKRERDNAWYETARQWRADYEAYSPETSYERCFGSGALVHERFGQLLEEIVELKKRVAELEARS